WWTREASFRIGLATRRWRCPACGLLRPESQDPICGLTLPPPEGRYCSHVRAALDRRLLTRLTPEHQDPSPLPRSRPAHAGGCGPRQRVSLLQRGADPACARDPPTPAPADAAG